MTPRLLKIVEQVIRRSNRNHPADAVLRETLRAERALSAAESRAVSQAVFTYYRWKGWLENERDLPRRIFRAQELAERFHQNPFSLPAEALRAKAVPHWVAGEVNLQEEWLKTLQREPKLWLRARRGQGKTLARRLGGKGKTPLPDAVLYEGKQDLFATPEFHAGEFELQDISSQAVGIICHPQAGEIWWDACAGEGGKTLHLAELMENKGLLWASDRAAWRLQQLKRRAARAGVFNYRAAFWDGGARLPVKTKFDGVLVDAPCSGLGTWQRNPHARWTTTLDDVKELAAIQQQLLAHASAAVKPGGKLIYSVCTLTDSETRAVADAFENRFSVFQPLPVVHPFLTELPESPRAWIWPQHCGGNGMFVAAWKRTSDS